MFQRTPKNLLIAILLFQPLLGISQFVERVPFDGKDSTNGYYLAVPPSSHQIKGTLVLLCSFRNPESILPETKLHNVAFANDLLTIYVSMGAKICADTAAIERINAVLKHVIAKYAPDTAKFVMAGYDFAGTIALRYTEFSYEHPASCIVHPKAVFAIASFVDLFGLWHWFERQIKKNYYPGTVGDAKALLALMTKEHGTIYDNAEYYKSISPFYKADAAAGNEQYLKNVALRLYYDTDINWQLTFRRNGYDDTNLPDASELVNRLLLAGDKDAEFVSSRLPGMRSNGMRNASAFSIVDEVDCIQWIKRKLDIFDPVSWVPPYQLAIPDKWSIERFSLPPEFAPALEIKGVQELRFPPGWGDPKSEDYWSYGIFWWITGDQPVDADILEKNMTILYQGLIGRNIRDRNIPAIKVVPTIVKIKKIQTVAGDRETYSGSVHMLDYLAQQPIVLNCLIHVKAGERTDHKAIFFEISPKPAEQGIWQELNNISRNFRTLN